MVNLIIFTPRNLYAQDNKPVQGDGKITESTGSPQEAQAEKNDQYLGSAYSGEGGQASEGTNPSAQPNEEPVATVNTWDFITMILGLLVVVGIIYLIYFILKKGMRRKVVENELIKVLGSRIITGTKALHLVEVGGSIYLVGSANDSLSLIAEVTEKDAKDTIRLASAQSGEVKPPRFADLLSGIFKPKVKKQLGINESIDFIKHQRKRLNKMKE